MKCWRDEVTNELQAIIKQSNCSFTLYFGCIKRWWSHRQHDERQCQWVFLNWRVLKREPVNKQKFMMCLINKYNLSMCMLKHFMLFYLITQCSKRFETEFVHSEHSLHIFIWQCRLWTGRSNCEKKSSYCIFVCSLKTLDPTGNFQRPVFSLGIYSNICIKNKPVQIWAQSVSEVAR